MDQSLYYSSHVFAYIVGTILNFVHSSAKLPEWLDERCERVAYYPTDLFSVLLEETQSFHIGSYFELADSRAMTWVEKIHITATEVRAHLDSDFVYYYLLVNFAHRGLSELDRLLNNLGEEEWQLRYKGNRQLFLEMIVLHAGEIVSLETLIAEHEDVLRQLHALRDERIGTLTLQLQTDVEALAKEVEVTHFAGGQT